MPFTTAGCEGEQPIQAMPDQLCLPTAEKKPLSSEMHQDTRTGGWVGPKASTSITRGLAREGKQGQPQDRVPSSACSGTRTPQPSYPKVRPSPRSPPAALIACSTFPWQCSTPGWPLDTMLITLLAQQSRGQRQSPAFTSFHQAPEAEWRGRHRGGFLG